MSATAPILTRPDKAKTKLNNAMIN